MQGYIDITLRYMKQHKKRTILTMVGIMLAISLFSSVSALILSNRDAQIQNTKQNIGNYEAEYKQIDETALNKIINNAEISNYGILQETPTVQALENGKEYKFDIKAYNKSAYDYIYKGYFDIKEGRLPAEKDEIVIENRALYTMGKKVGDSIKMAVPGNDEVSGNTDKLYKIVGTYEERFFTSDIFNGISYLKDEASKEKGIYNVFVNLKERKDKSSAANKLGRELGLKVSENRDESQVSINEQLLMAEGLMGYSLLNDSEIRIMAIIFIIIMVCSATVIYNAFNIAVVERIRQFGILRAIGATPGQIRNIVFKEAFYMCLVAIPLGIITGYAGLIGVLKAVKKVRNINYDILKIGFYPEAIFICIILGVITVILSVWAPAKSAGRISPIEAIKNINEIRNEKIKKRKTKIIRLLFKYEGELAYKNITRTPKRFWFTVSSLIISIVLLVVYSNYMSIIKQQRDRDHDLSNADAAFSKINGDFTQDEINEIKNLSGVDRIYLRAKNSCYFAFPNGYVNPDYLKKTGRNEYHAIEGTDFVATVNTKMSFYDDNALELSKKYLIDGKIDKNALNNMGVLLVNKNRVIVGTGSREVTADYSTYKVGDKIVVPKIDYYPFAGKSEDDPGKFVNRSDEMKKAIDNKEFYTFTVVGILDKDFLGGPPQDGLGLIFTEDVYKKINGSLDSRNMLIKFRDKDAREKLYEYFSKKAVQTAGIYYDYYKVAEQERKMDAQVNLFVYGFIALVTLIAAVNIINTIVLNIMLRKREFASMRAIGMTKVQLTKMLLFEGLIHGVIAAFIGIIIGGILTKLTIATIVSDVKVSIPYGIIVTGIIISVILALTATIIPLGRLKKMNIVESLRME